MKKNSKNILLSILAIVVLILLVLLLLFEYDKLKTVKQMKEIVVSFNEKQKECKIIGATANYIYISRYDENNNPIKGAKINVTTPDGKTVGIIETNEKGNGGLVGLDFGEYYVEEKEVPDGYKLKECKYKVIISESDTSYSINISNAEPNSSLVILVTDKEGNPVKGIEYAILDEAGNKINTLTTNYEGSAAIEKLPEGIYHVQELNKANAEMYTAELENEKVKGLKIIHEED